MQVPSRVLSPPPLRAVLFEGPDSLSCLGPFSWLSALLGS